MTKARGKRHFWKRHFWMLWCMCWALWGLFWFAVAVASIPAHPIQQSLIATFQLALAIFQLVYFTMWYRRK